jgi:acyl carrier protein
MSDDVAASVRAFIIDRLLFGQGGDDLRDDESLLDKGVMDSTGALEIVAFVEEQYGISVGDREMVPENLDGIGRIAAFVARKRG